MAIDAVRSVVVVTGAARGLGRATAHRFAAAGFRLMLNDVNLESGREVSEALFASSVATECEALGTEAAEIEVDISRPFGAMTVLEATLESFGRVDAWINVAGGLLVAVEDSVASTMSEEGIKRILEVNLMTTIFGCQAAVRGMREVGGGAIVNFSSQASWRLRTSGALASYGAAKAAINQYTRVLAAEVGPLGIRVNAVAPGFIATTRARRQLGRGQDPRELERIPLRRLGEPGDVAEVVYFLATERSRYVTGQVLAVCGGSSLPGV